MPASPDTLVFDAYGTILDLQAPARAAERHFPGRGEAINLAWRRKQLDYMWLRSLMGRYDDFAAVTADALDWTLESLGLAATAEVRAELLRSWRELECFPDAKPALARLARGRTLAILSNGHPDMLDAVIDRNDLRVHFGERVYSVHEAGVFKPDPRVYQLATSALERPPEAIGFVSSNGWDAAGGKSFGFVAYWVNRARAPAERLGARPDEEFPDLLAMADRLG